MPSKSLRFQNYFHLLYNLYRGEYCHTWTFIFHFATDEKLTKSHMVCESTNFSTLKRLLSNVSWRIWPKIKMRLIRVLYGKSDNNILCLSIQIENDWNRLFCWIHTCKNCLFITIQTVNYTENKVIANAVYNHRVYNYHLYAWFFLKLRLSGYLYSVFWCNTTQSSRRTVR